MELCSTSSRTLSWAFSARILAFDFLPSSFFRSLSSAPLLNHFQALPDDFVEETLFVSSSLFAFLSARLSSWLRVGIKVKLSVREAPPGKDDEWAASESLKF